MMKDDAMILLEAVPDLHQTGAAKWVEEAAHILRQVAASSSEADQRTPWTDYAATRVQFAVTGKDQYEVVSADFARQLERELAEMREEIVILERLREDRW